MTDAPVIAERAERIGRIRLNQPRSLNALTLPMIRGISEALDWFEQDPDVHAVVIDSTSERAFCAGGDVKAIHADVIAGNLSAARCFFETEYALNLRISSYTKPYVALIDGICMGGGIGISIYGCYRVASERALFAMPETSIGLFPDIGASYFLPRLPGRLGSYLGLTGARLQGADAVHGGLATHFVPSIDFPALISAMKTDGVAPLAHFARPLGPFSLNTHRELIDHSFGADTIGGIVTRIADNHGEFARDTLKAICAASPSSLFWTVEIMERGERSTLRNALAAELDLIMRVVTQRDFHEGIRAMLIDKDRSPRWQPPKIEAVDPAVVNAIFH
jgi:enoyl-CoA hydratase